MDAKRSRIHKLARLLKKELSPAYNVSVRIVRRKIYSKNEEGKKVECDGICWLDLEEKKFYINIAYNECLTCMMDSLKHEWSHILDWSHLHDMKEEPEYHSATWGVWYAKVYRLISGDK
jgi:hypothetical protein